MKTKRSWLLLALPLTLAACGADEEETPQTPADSAIAAIDAPDADPMAGMASTLSLQPMGGATTSGQATVTPNGAQTQVQIQLSGLTPGAHPGHIHSGTCEAPGEVLQPLPVITAGQDGAGTADTTLALDATTVMDGQHIIAYHGDGGAPVACGSLMAHAM